MTHTKNGEEISARYEKKNRNNSKQLGKKQTKGKIGWGVVAQAGDDFKRGKAGYYSKAEIGNTQSVKQRSAKES